MTSQPWLMSRRYDVLLFQLSGWAAMLLMIPYFVFGQSVVLPIYGAYVVLFGLPHNYLTWAATLPPAARKSYDMELFYSAALTAAALCLLVPLARGSALELWVRTLIVLWASWHAYRQHHGICKIYDAVQAQRTGDRAIFADRKLLNVFFGLGIFAVIVWLFTFEHLEFVLQKDEKYSLVYPQIPPQVFKLYLVVTAVTGVFGFKMALWDRHRAGKPLPWPQVTLIVSAIVVSSLPYMVMPVAAMPLAVAIMSIHHNVQYFGFVWMYERHRSPELAAGTQSLQLPQRLALEGRWRAYFGLALVYSLVMIGAFKAMPRHYGLGFMYFLSVFHYIVDGFIWRRQGNPMVSSVLKRIGVGYAPGLST